jgi:hypothetical protein
MPLLLISEHVLFYFFTCGVILPLSKYISIFPINFIPTVLLNNSKIILFSNHFHFFNIHFFFPLPTTFLSSKQSITVKFHCVIYLLGSSCIQSFHVSCNRDLPASERAKWKIHDNLVRFSFGVEDFEDLKADVLQALEAI